MRHTPRQKELCRFAEVALTEQGLLFSLVATGKVLNAKDQHGIDERVALLASDMPSRSRGTRAPLSGCGCYSHCNAAGRRCLERPKVAEAADEDSTRIVEAAVYKLCTESGVRPRAPRQSE